MDPKNFFSLAHFATPITHLALPNRLSARFSPEPDKQRKAEEASLTFDNEKRSEMLTLPQRMIQGLRSFEEALSERGWKWARALLIGARLSPGE